MVNHPIAQDGWDIIHVCIAMLVLVGLALSLRVLARTRTKQHFQLEEWFIWISTILFITYNGVLIGAITNPNAGGTSEFLKLTLPQLNNLEMYTYVFELLFVNCITFAKISLLIFYTHVFTVRSFRNTAYCFIAFCAIWGIVSTFLVIFQCNPVAGLWHYEWQVEGIATCIPPLPLLFGFEVSNVALDIAILALPVSVINRLQLKRSKKISISFIFLLGGFVCVSCAVRMYWIYVPDSPLPRSQPAVLNWSTVELASAIICTCLPTYGPLFTGERSVLASAKTWYASLISSRGGSSYGKTTGNSSTGPYNSIGEKDIKRSHIVNQRPVKRGIEDQSIDNLPLRQINVTREYEVV